MKKMNYGKSKLKNKINFLEVQVQKEFYIKEKNNLLWNIELLDNDKKELKKEKENIEKRKGIE